MLPTPYHPIPNFPAIIEAIEYENNMAILKERWKEIKTLEKGL